MKRFATLTILVLLTMLLLAGTVSANMTGAPVTPWANSNRSGETAVVWDGAPLLRNVPGQLIHTDFQLNTNSCASCHMTHTAVGARLLIADTTTATCNVCHNGTLGFLNVRAAANAVSPTGGSVAAGTFNLNATRTPSMHNADGIVRLSNAPGGNRTATTGSWAGRFTCASCHAPHGSHSIRLLHLNPNDIAGRVSVDTVVYGVYSGFRILRAGVPGFTVDSASWVSSRNVYLYPQVFDAVYAPPWVAGTVSIFHNSVESTVALATYFTVNLGTGEVMQTAIQRADLITRLTNPPFSLGENAGTARLNLSFGRGLRVRAQVNERHRDDLVRGARAFDFINPNSYDAPTYNLFCAACHTDYLPLIAGSAQRIAGTGVGAFSTKFRHTINRSASVGVDFGFDPMPVTGGTGFDGPNLIGTTVGRNRLMCLSCHFAHGTDASMMLLADNTRIRAGEGLPGTPTDPQQNDISASNIIGGSSALKRYINQASCWHCHVRSRSTVFENTDYFWDQFPSGLTW